MVAGMDSVCRLTQFANVLAPITSTAGIDTDTSELQPLKLPLVSVILGRVTDDRDVQSRNASLPIEVSDPELNVVIEVHSRNAELPMEVYTPIELASEKLEQP